MTQIEFARRNSHIRELAQNYTVEQISQIEGLSPQRVKQILKSFKVKAVKISKNLDSKLAQDIINELKAGTKQSDIARKFNISRQYVSQIKFRYEKTLEHK